MSTTTAPVRFFQFGDPQIGMGLDGAEGDTRRLAIAVEHANTRALGPETVLLLCGDLVHWASAGSQPCPPAELDGVVTGISQFKGTVLRLPGNHDIFSPASRALYLSTHNLAESYYAHTVPGVTFVVLDATTLIKEPKQYEEVERKHGEGQWAWIETVLGEARKRGDEVVVAGHYPVYIFDEDEEDCYWTFAAGPRRRFMSLMRAHSVRHYFCGHMHRTFAATTRKGDFTVWVVGGTSTVTDEKTNSYGYRVFDLIRGDAAFPPLSDATTHPMSQHTLLRTSYVRLDLPSDAVPPSCEEWSHLWPKLPARPEGVVTELVGV
ncbi:Metallo-dependent phosphatase [Gonapodya prolifera JEL478]|uniref:Metallo-dependent phosphatase n=1 Tax=Gonapodya prolifera (strain JEL478) TaxID=1344416 RepID=A0A139AE46_GONPJ|nr:Metallo-dependent phosphatase [Gonapodya prolifera JEL478]|eukprot:KXS14864.1 Metallo-dependent phosphatase [Gonapodya prolifera JEL478]